MKLRFKIPYYWDKELSTMRIDSYSFGSMTADGMEYSSDLIIFPERIISHWWRIDGHVLAAEDLEEVINYKPQLLIVGTGASARLKISLSTRRELQKNQIKQSWIF